MVRLVSAWFGPGGELLSVGFAKYATVAIGFLALMAGLSGPAMAMNDPTPELGTGSVVISAFMALGGDVLIVTGRYPRN